METSDGTINRWLHISHPIAITCAALLLALLTAGTGYRIYRQYAQPELTEFDWSKRGFSDFNNGVYLPTQAFLAGVNPFAQEAVEQFTLARACPPYSPVTFMVHTPFTWFSARTAGVVYFFYNILLALLMAYCGIRMSGGKFAWFGLLALGSLILFSRPGHINIFTGYFTAELVLGTLVALHFAKSKPIVSGFGMVLASSKPTYILPLAIMMMWRKNYRATIFGCFLCGVFAFGGLAWLAHHSSFEDVITGIAHGQDAHIDDVTEHPINTWTRIDLLGMFAKVINWNPDTKINILAMFFLTIVPGLAVAKAVKSESNSGACGLTGWIVCLSMLVCLYHHSYDCLLLVAPWIGVTFFGSRTLPEIGRWARIALSVLTAVPAANYLSTQSARDKLGFEQLDFAWQSITMINGGCLIVALGILMYYAFTLRPSSDSNS